MGPEGEGIHRKSFRHLFEQEEDGASALGLGIGVEGLGRIHVQGYLTESNRALYSLPV